MLIIINKKTLMIFFLAIIIIFFLIFKFTLTEKSIETSITKGRIALVIDDLGNNGEGIDELTKLDIPITAAVMPFLEYTEIDAKKAHEAGMEIILHLPMEPEKGDPKWLGPRAIRSNFCNDEIKEIVYDALEQLKWAKGINNHMGSKIMKDEMIMKEIINIAKEKDIYFLNSKTDESKISEEISKELGVVYFQRNVFLDNERTEYYISKAMDELSKIALDKGYAIGIGHVGGQGGKITINTIDKMSEKLKGQGIEFIYLSQVKDLYK
ncbi:divergent polysaccharide deacetylase family protein [Tissierella sp.]|uniref:divergent polysaccharide deacetylase family protein n=1 Tax=Tissierella sp. TaxID=41274 RepID=UPI0028ADD8C7|nr:divergent polysaccharide deacetylase family protein [Tissierella sp.]